MKDGDKQAETNNNTAIVTVFIKFQSEEVVKKADQ